MQTLSYSGYPPYAGYGQGEARSARLHPMGILFLMILGVVVLEGAIRKWVLPGSTFPLLALRDGMALSGVVLTYVNHWSHDRTWHGGGLILWSMLVMLWAGIQMLLEDQPYLIGFIGLRSWLFYFWFAYACANTLTRRDIERVLTLSSVILLPMAILAVVQYESPPTAPINRQVFGNDSGRVFLAIGNTVRTTGTFSFTAGFGQFLLFASPAVLSLLLGGLKLPSFLKWSIVAAYVVAAGVSGSRTTVVTSGLFVAAAGFLVIIQTKSKSGNAAKLAIAIAIGIVALPYFLSDAIETTEARFEFAATNEDGVARVMGILLGRSYIWQTLNFWGQGIGLGNNAAAALDVPGAFYGENESERVLYEAGLLGLIYALGKIVILAIGAVKSLSHARHFADPLPALLWVAAAVELSTAPMLGQLTTHAFAWLIMGLAWASIKPRNLDPDGHSDAAPYWR